ncbi:MAG: phospholipid carrier-dependent glycosyltransferase [Blastocatellia bacterium]|nr:phospholipid carrier-dependent glycosyltransferase [Blastocatellia bacterium]
MEPQNTATGKLNPPNPATRTGMRWADTLATILLAGLVSVFVFFASRRLETVPAPLGDEPWLMQTAYELITHGSLGLPMFRLVGGNIERVWMTMPGLFLSLAAFFKSFGAGLEQARAYNLTSACLVLVLVFLIGRKLHSRGAGLLAAFTLGFDANFFHIARIFRNDIPTVACALAGFYFFLRAQVTDNPRRAWLWGFLAGFLTAFAILIHPNGLYMIGLVFLWALVEQGWRMLLKIPWWAFVAGVAFLAVPCAIYVFWHFQDFAMQWHSDSVHYRGVTPKGFWKNVSTEYLRYDLWGSGVLSIATSDSRAVQVFRYGIFFSVVYLAARTIRALARTGWWQGIVDRFESFTPRGREQAQDRTRFYELTEEEKRSSGSFQAWMLHQGGWRRRLTLAWTELEEESRPVTTWLQALGAPSHPAWRAPRAGLVLVTLATLLFFAAVDTQKSPAYLPYATSWYALCCGVAVVDGIRWGWEQRRRSAKRVLAGLAILGLVVGMWGTYAASASRSAWRFYRWSRTFDPAPYSDLGAVLQKVIPKDVIPVGRPVHWLAFMDNSNYLSANKRIWKAADVTTQPYVMIVDQGLQEKDNFSRPFSKQEDQFTILAELENTLYGNIKIYYTGQDGRFKDKKAEHYYFFGDFSKGFGRKGYYTEEQRQLAKVIWLAGPRELEQLARRDTSLETKPPTIQRDGERSALRIVTDVSSFNTRVRLPLPQLKPYTIYRLQMAVHVPEGGCLLGPRDQTGLWLTEPAAIEPGNQYVPVDLIFCTNGRGDGELAIGNRRNRPAASLIYIAQVELREICPRP